MSVLVCGSRGWTSSLPIYDRLGELPAGTEVLVGDAKGADLMARNEARGFGLNVTVYYADWSTHGKRAGILRNLEMLDEQPELVIAFWDGESRGTKHTIDEAARRGIPVEILAPSGRAV